jgi:hypothetical protein
LAMTGVLFKMIDSRQFPAEIDLILNFDLPLRKVPPPIKWAWQ